MKKVLVVFSFLILLAGISQAKALNPLGPMDPGNSHNGTTWTMTLNGYEYVVDGNVDDYKRVRKEYKFRVRVADMGGWLYPDSSVCLHSWQLFAADIAGTKFMWYGWMDGGFDTLNSKGFVSGRVEFVAPGIFPHEAFPFSFTGRFFKINKKGEVTEIRGRAVSGGMAGQWPQYWSGEYDLMMDRNE